MAEGGGDERHVQVAFFSKTEEIPGTKDAVFDVPLSSDWEKLNALVNAVAATANDEWKEKRFELLIGSTFIHSPIRDFFDENIIDIERVVKIECIAGYEPPKPSLSISGPDWISSLQILEKLFLATSYNGEFLAFDRKGKKVASHQRESTAIKCSCVLATPSKGLDGLRTASGGESGAVWLEEWTAKGEAVVVAALRGHARSVETLAVGAQGTRLLSGSFDDTIKVWNLEDSSSDIFESCAPTKSKKEKKETFVTKTPMVTLSGHTDAVVAVQWSPLQTAKAFSASWDHSILLWDLELAGQVSRLGASRAFNSLHVHPRTEEIITGSTDALPRLFDARSTEGSVVKESFAGHKGWVTCVRWTEKDDFSFVSSSFDGTVKMWDKRSAKTPLFDLGGHEDRVLCCAVGEGTLLSGGVDAKINVFSL